MKKIAKAMLLITLAGMLYSLFNLKNQETPPQKNLESPAIESAVPVCPQPAEKDSGILADIRRAQKMLEKEDAGFIPSEKNGKGNWQVEDFNFLLAVRNPDNNIKIISVGSETVSTSGEYVIERVRKNGIASPFSVIYPEGCAVLKVKKMMKDEKDLFREVVYTPYSAAIDCQELRDAGMNYLKSTIHEARKQLTQVSSLAHEGRTVAETTSEEQALVLAIIEHIDPDRLLRGEPIEQLMGEVLVIIGANQEMAYRFSVSSANARGLFQFIPPTYALIKDKYPDAALHQDFVEGMNNHKNAAMASMLLFDSDLSYLKDQKVFAGSDLVLGKQLASAYNCGVKRTAREIKAHKNMWERKVPPETRLYLKKFNAAWDSLFGA